MRWSLDYEQRLARAETAEQRWDLAMAQARREMDEIVAEQPPARVRPLLDLMEQIRAQRAQARAGEPPRR